MGYLIGWKAQVQTRCGLRSGSWQLFDLQMDPSDWLVFIVNYTTPVLGRQVAFVRYSTANNRGWSDCTNTSSSTALHLNYTQLAVALSPNSSRVLISQQQGWSDNELEVFDTQRGCCVWRPAASPAQPPSVRWPSSTMARTSSRGVATALGRAWARRI